MRILIAGGSGLIGKVLVNALQEQYAITVLGRDIEKLNPLFSSQVKKISWDCLSHQNPNDFDVVINLCGSNIAENRWSPQVKQNLIDSRTHSNTLLINWIIASNASPRYFCASAIGIYGAEFVSDNEVTEESILPASPKDFLQTITYAWEGSLQPAINAGIAVTILRFGVVLKRGEGMLKQLELPFQLGLGTIVGSGEQTLSWVHHADLASAVKTLIENPTLVGAFNITSPNSVTQAEFARALSTTLKRPLWLRLPALLVKMLFGEMGEYLLLRGQQVIPKRLLDHEFTFQYPSIASALQSEYGK